MGSASDTRHAGDKAAGEDARAAERANSSAPSAPSLTAAGRPERVLAGTYKATEAQLDPFIAEMQKGEF